MFKYFHYILNKRKVEPPKIGVLYICTGKYHIFWDEFYKTANKYFCKKSEVHYFVYTEQLINTYGNKNVHHVFQSKLGWPFDTLKRFHLFLRENGSLKKMDYLYFFNANMIFKSKVTENEILPSPFGNGLVAVIHPYFYDHKNMAPFENNPNSSAYVKTDIFSNYFQGCLSGGRTHDYLLMASELVKMIDSDLSKNIIGKWWDESYMNKYFQINPPQLLPPSFAYPESGTFPFPKIIVQLDKGKHGGHSFLRS